MIFSYVFTIKTKDLYPEKPQEPDKPDFYTPCLDYKFLIFACQISC